MVLLMQRRTRKVANYQELKSQLEEIIIQLEDVELEIDKATSLYKEGQKIIVKLEKYLDEAKQKFEVINKS